MSCFLRPVTKWLALLSFSALVLMAQTGLGTIRGTVTDPTGAVMQKATVVLTEAQTGVRRTTATSEVGIYYFGNVPIGPYTVTIEAVGFAKWSGTLTLEAGQSAVADAAMEIGASGTMVEVTGAVAIIETQKGSVSDVKDALRIHELPLNGRMITNLLNLTPGVEGGGTPRTNGMKVGSTDMMLDGISMVDRFTGGMAQVQPGLDIVQEFRFETAGSDAAYSRPATVSVVSKSGTNQIHGNAFETHRNNFGGLRARQRQDFYSTPPEYIRNEYGGTVSGPLIKNKTFWLFSYEGMKLRQVSYAQTQVPSDAIWGGDFSGATDTSGLKYTIYDPLTTNAGLTRTPFSGNVIPKTRIAPIGGVMKGVTPAPTDTSVNAWLVPNFKVYYPNTQDFNTQSAKFDQIFSEKDNLSVRYTRSSQKNVRVGGRFGFPPPGCTDCGGSGLSTFDLSSAIVRENHVFRPNLMNEFQASVNRSPNHQGQLSDATNWADKLGLPNPFGATGWPSIYTSDWWFLYGGGWDAGNPKDQNQTQFQIEDNVTWIKGKHTVQFGFRGRREQSNVREMQQAQGSHSFGSDWTANFDPAGQQMIPYTGDGFASLELGLPTYLSNQFNRGYFYFQQKEFGLYFQDSWKATSRLTLNFGLRWDKWTPYHEKYNRLVNFDPLTLAATGMQVITPGSTTIESIPGIPPTVLTSWKNRGLTWQTADQANFPSALMQPVNGDFGPRLGVAYRLGDKMVLRASYGMYYWTMPLSQILQSSRTNPPLNLSFVNDISNQNGTYYNYAMSVSPAAKDFVGVATVTASGVSAASQKFTPFDPNTWSDDRMQQWTFVIERQLGKDNALRLNYIGNHASNLEQRWAFNDPMSVFNYRASSGLVGSSNADTRRINPNWNGQAVRHNGYANSQSFQFEFEHRTSHGLTFQGFYTFAHAMSTTDAGGSSSGDGNVNANGSGYSFMVPSNSEIIGNPTLSEAQRLRLGYTNSGDVPPHHVRWNGVYELPFGKGKKFGSGSSGVLNHVIGGWSLGFIGEWRSGFWMGVNSGYYLFGDPTLSKDQRFAVDIFGKQQQVYFRGYFDSTQAKGPNAAQLLQLVPADFTKRVLTRVGANNNLIAQTLKDGTVVQTNITDNLNWNARNFFQGPGAWNEDLAVYKTFTIKEKYRLRFAADFFNAFNHPNSLTPNTLTGLLDLSQQANDPRIIQISGKFEF